MAQSPDAPVACWPLDIRPPGSVVLVRKRVKSALQLGNAAFSLDLERMAMRVAAIAARPECSRVLEDEGPCRLAQGHAKGGGRPRVQPVHRPGTRHHLAIT